VEELAQLVEGERGAGDGDDDGAADLAPPLVGHADDTDVGDGGVLEDGGLHLGGVHVLAAGDVHVLHPVADGVEAVVVDDRGVAAAEPAVVVDGRGGGVGPVPVALHDVGPV